MVLIYHRVGGGSGTEVDLPAQAFDEQMAWLAATGRVVSLDDAVDCCWPAPTAGAGRRAHDDGRAAPTTARSS